MKASLKGLKTSLSCSRLLFFKPVYYCASIRYYAEMPQVAQSQDTLDIKQVQNVKFRAALNSVLNESLHINTKKTLIGNKWNNFVDIKIFPFGGQTDSLIIVSFGDVKYYVNPGSEFEKALHAVGEGPTIDTILFTKCNWQTAVDNLSWLSKDKIHGNSLNICGPHNTQYFFLTVLPLLKSIRGAATFKNKVIFSECHEPGIVAIKKDRITVKMINFNSNNINVQTHIGYILDYTVNNYRNESSQKSYEDFPTVEMYMDYVIQRKNTFSATEKQKTSKSQKEKLSVGIFECPDVSKLEAMLANTSLLLEDITVCLHMTPKDLFYSQTYSKWLEKFGSCQHILAADVIKNYDFPNKFHQYRALLHTLHPSFFPLYNKSAFKTLQINLEQAFRKKEFGYLQISPKQIRYLFERKRKRDCKKAIELLNKCPSLSKPHHISRQSVFPNLVVLGSGSVQFSPHRSSACYLLQVDRAHSILIDCGPNGFSQLVDHFGADRARRILSTLRAIIITHKHSDHWSGLLKLLVELSKQKRHHDLLVFAPQTIVRFFAARYKSRVLKNIVFTAIEEFHFNLTIAKLLHVKKLSFHRVDHGPPTYGVVLYLHDNYKLVYSSDTLSLCDALIKAGKDADLLIHDCLYASIADKAMADIRMHSCAEGAVETGNLMNARNLLLVHFAPYYGLFPLDVNQFSLRRSPGDNVAVAFDHLELPLKRFNDYSRFLKSVAELSSDKESLYKQKRIEEVFDIFKKCSDSINVDNYHN